jgi:hypothetical protein
MTTPLRIGIIGDNNPDFHPHQATDAAIEHAADYLHAARDRRLGDASGHLSD